MFLSPTHAPLSNRTAVAAAAVAALLLLLLLLLLPPPPPPPPVLLLLTCCAPMRPPCSGNGSVEFEEFCDWFWKETPAEERERLIVVYYEDAAGKPATTTMAELEVLLQAGTITQQTKVWIDGMEDWMAFSESSVQSKSPRHADAVRKQQQQQQQQ